MGILFANGSYPRTYLSAEELQGEVVDSYAGPSLAERLFPPSRAGRVIGE
jgi:hypothetical protein